MKHFNNFVIVIWTIAAIIGFNSCLELMTEKDTLLNWLGLFFGIFLIYISYESRLGVIFVEQLEYLIRVIKTKFKK